MMRAALLGLLLVTALAAPILQQTPFATLKQQSQPKVAVFYRKSDPGAKQVLRQVARAARRLAKEFPHMTFAKCDGDLADNAKEFEEAGFNSGAFVFTQTPDAGIGKLILYIV
jgi:hypothetical protein